MKRPKLLPTQFFIASQASSALNLINAIMMLRTFSVSLAVLLLAAFSLYVSSLSAQEIISHDKTESNDRLERLIQAQQQQIEFLQQQLNELKRTVTLQTETKVAKNVAEEARNTEQSPVEDVTHRAKWEKWAPVGDVHPDDKVVTSGQERIKLSISGMVNRAVNIVDDGRDTDAYFVDNDNAESRVTFLGKAKINDDLTVGSKLELTIAPDRAGNVNQIDKEAGDVFEQRWASVGIESKRFGKLSLGKGFTASYGTASRDLSKTNVIAYVNVADTAGGMLFRQENDDSLTDLPINMAFQSYDGLNRRSRVRYDTPEFNGFRLSSSLLTDQRYDGALWWGGQGNGFKAIAGASLADPKIDGADMQYAGSYSMLHDRTGLSLTLSTGLLERETLSDAKNYYTKLGWQKNFFTFGSTAFSVDYNQTKNQPAEDDDGYSIGLAAVQHFEKYGSELYFLIRKYSLDRDLEPEVEDIDVVSLGSRIKF
ncbi:MAG: porin [Pseudomonadales bacterium]